MEKNTLLNLTNITVSKEHKLTTDCWCNPYLDGEDGTVIAHTITTEDEQVFHVVPAYPTYKNNRH